MITRDAKMNTQFQQEPCIQYERTFDISTEDHDSHKLVVLDYAKAANRRSAGKKNIRRAVQDLDVVLEEILQMYNIFVDACGDLGMPVDRRWHTQWGQNYFPSESDSLRV
eukprot:jgi/Psemu1/34403/gm1.34403_g